MLNYILGDLNLADPSIIRKEIFTRYLTSYRLLPQIFLASEGWRNRVPSAPLKRTWGHLTNFSSATFGCRRRYSSHGTTAGLSINESDV